MRLIRIKLRMSKHSDVGIQTTGNSTLFSTVPAKHHYYEFSKNLNLTFVQKFFLQKLIRYLSSWDYFQ